MCNAQQMVLLAMVTVLLWLAGCTTAVQTTPMALDETRYDPAVARYPAKVGVYFPADFYENDFYHETDDGYHHTFHNNPAGASRRALDLAFAATFEDVQHLDSLQQGINAPDLAFLIVPNIVTMRSRLTPQTIAVGIVYQFDFFADGEHIHSWQITGFDYVNGPAVQTLSTHSGPVTREVRNHRPIFPEKFDAVARKAVWDALSVFLIGLDRQSPLADRLPTAVVTERADHRQRLSTRKQNTLAMVGPIYDQVHDPAMQQLEACLIEEFQDNDLPLTSMTLRNLREQLYPWLSRSNYPFGLNDLALIIKEPAVKERLRELGVQYVLNWNGETTRSEFEGPFLASVYGFLGYESADKTSVIKAELLAVEDGSVVKSFETTQEGTDLLLGLVAIPVPIFEDTEEDACEEIIREIESFVRDSEQQQQTHR